MNKTVMIISISKWKEIIWKKGYGNVSYHEILGWYQISLKQHTHLSLSLWKLVFTFIRAQLFVHYSFPSTYGAISMYNCLPIT